MRHHLSLTKALVSIAALLCACSSEETSSLTPDQKLITSVKETASFTLAGLSDEVHVVRTEADIPHIYAKNRRDLARVQGFVIARDRYFMMDLARRLGQVRVSELLGDSALATDQEWRGQGSAAPFCSSSCTSRRGEGCSSWSSRPTRCSGCCASEAGFAARSCSRTTGSVLGWPRAPRATGPRDGSPSPRRPRARARSSSPVAVSSSAGQGPSGHVAMAGPSAGRFLMCESCPR